MITIVVGRGDVDLQVNDSSLSRRHAQFCLRDDERVEVTDLESTNGTFWLPESGDEQRISVLTLPLQARIRLGTMTTTLAQLLQPFIAAANKQRIRKPVFSRYIRTASGNYKERDE